MTSPELLCFRGVGRFLYIALVYVLYGFFCARVRLSCIIVFHLILLIYYARIIRKKYRIRFGVFKNADALWH